jgi:hypothetical protein
VLAVFVHLDAGIESCINLMRPLLFSNISNNIHPFIPMKIHPFNSLCSHPIRLFHKPLIAFPDGHDAISAPFLMFPLNSNKIGLIKFVYGLIKCFHLPI